MTRRGKTSSSPGASPPRGARSSRPKRSKRRIRVGVIFGGRSVEHEVSLVSARAVIAALDPARYEVVPIGITKRGRWAIGGTHCALPPDPSVGGLIEVKGDTSRRAVRVRGGRHRTPSAQLDVIFPVVHGTGGEDGALQGLLTLAGIPYVGASVLGSALGMDKAAMKALFREAGLPCLDFRVVRRCDLDGGVEPIVDSLERAFGYPCFVKPANGGSSVGVSKAKDRAGLLQGLDLARRYDRKVIVEPAIDAREIECSVLGNDAPEASVPGEIVPANEFYDYRAKYVDAGSRLVIPAPIPEEAARQVRSLAIRAFQILDLEGMARVDFFLDRRTGEILLNEVNTIPGFTPISMYPKLWEASGLPFTQLVDRLIQLALERHAEQRALVTSYDAGNNGTGEKA